MKPIKLTKEHKAKLLEMCKALFPEYNNIYIFNKDQEGEYKEEDFINFGTYKVNDLCFLPGYNRALHTIISKESSALFPVGDNRWTWWHKDIVAKYAKQFDIPKQPTVVIHWFEFVFLYLITRLQQNMPDEVAFREQPPYVGNVFRWKKGDRWTLYTEFLFHYPKSCKGGSNHPINPIDYLYTEFKKIK